MKHTIFFFLFIVSLNTLGESPCTRFALVLHGGAGSWNKISESDKLKYKAKMEEALRAGFKILDSQRPGLHAVQVAIEILEDSGLLNAGKGAVKNSEGRVELDASIMDGKTRKAGAVGAVRTLKNPIHAARLVMEKTWHVLLVGTGGDSFAVKNGATSVEESYFNSRSASPFGTVGAVALDCGRNLAAGTSTGGLTGKLPGRLGDSPIIGAGTYAHNSTCAVSATGDGEYFIRASVAFSISSQMEHGKSLQAASQDALKTVAQLGGTGGVIAVDKSGNIATPFNTPGMLRGFVRQDGKTTVQF